MKQKQSVLTVRVIIFLLAAVVCSANIYAANTANDVPVIKKFTEDDKKPSKKGKSSKASTSSVIKIYPDALKRAMHVVARQGNEKEIDLYVFDVDGNMVANYKMKAGDRKVLSGLKKGSYVYHIFSEDESIGTGQMEFR